MSRTCRAIRIATGARGGGLFSVGGLLFFVGGGGARAEKTVAKSLGLRSLTLPDDRLTIERKSRAYHSASSARSVADFDR